MKRVVAYCEPSHTISRRMLEKAGFVLERMWKRAATDSAGGKWPEACVYLFADSPQSPVIRQAIEQLDRP